MQTDNQRYREIKLLLLLLGDLSELYTLINTDTHLSEGHGDGLWDARERLTLRVVFQEDAIALENHIWLTIDHQRALMGFKAHCVLKLASIGCHLGGRQ